MHLDDNLDACRMPWTSTPVGLERKHLAHVSRQKLATSARNSTQPLPADERSSRLRAPAVTRLES